MWWGNLHCAAHAVRSCAQPAPRWRQSLAAHSAGCYPVETCCPPPSPSPSPSSLPPPPCPGAGSHHGSVVAGGVVVVLAVAVAVVLGGLGQVGVSLGGSLSREVLEAFLLGRMC